MNQPYWHTELGNPGVVGGQGQYEVFHKKHKCVMYLGPLWLGCYCDLRPQNPD